MIAFQKEVDSLDREIEKVVGELYGIEDQIAIVEGA
jgi:hypothetical protein